MPICEAAITGSCQVLFSFSTSVHLECFAGPKDPEEKDLLLQKLWLWIFLHKIFKIINLYKQDPVILVTVTARSFEGSINLAKREKITHRQTEQLLRFPQVLKGGTLSSSKQLRDTLFDSWMKSSGHFECSSWAFVMTEWLVLSTSAPCKACCHRVTECLTPFKICSNTTLDCFPVETCP